MDNQAMNAKQATDKALEDRVRRAVDYFMKGYGCGQSVVAAFSDLYGMDEATALKVGNGFGGGVGKMRMMCGAASGLVILAGLESGKPSDEGASCAQAVSDDNATVIRSEDNATLIRKNKAECYRLVQNLLEKFRVANGSIICAELLGLSPESSVAGGEHGVSPEPSVAGGEHGVSPEPSVAGGEHGLSPEPPVAAGGHGQSPDTVVGTHGQSPDTVVGTHGQMHGLKSGPGDFTPSERNAEYYRTRPCAAKVESAARIFAEYLACK